MTLTIDNLSKRYGDTVALDGVSFDVQPGELFGFVGSNGAGKTTTMRIALGVLAADGGSDRYEAVISEVRDTGAIGLDFPQFASSLRTDGST